MTSVPTSSGFTMSSTKTMSFGRHHHFQQQHSHQSQHLLQRESASLTTGVFMQHASSNMEKPSKFAKVSDQLLFSNQNQSQNEILYQPQQLQNSQQQQQQQQQHHYSQQPLLQERQSNYSSSLPASFASTILDSHSLQYQMERTERRLKRLLSSEGEQSPCVNYLVRVQKGDITPCMRDKLFCWLDKLNRQFEYTTETFFLAVNYVERFLSRIRVKPRHLQLIALSAFMIAAKMSEEIEVKPTLQELVVCCDFAYSAGEMLRMEKTILEKLKWELNAATHENMLFHLLEMMVHNSIIPPLVSSSWRPQLGVGASPSLSPWAVGLSPFMAPLAEAAVEMEGIGEASMPVSSYTPDSTNFGYGSNDNSPEKKPGNVSPLSLPPPSLVDSSRSNNSSSNGNSNSKNNDVNLKSSTHHHSSLSGLASIQANGKQQPIRQSHQLLQQPPNQSTGAPLTFQQAQMMALAQRRQRGRSSSSISSTISFDPMISDDDENGLFGTSFAADDDDDEDDDAFPPAMEPEDEIAKLCIRRLVTCCCNYRITSFKPSTVASAVILSVMRDMHFSEDNYNLCADLLAQYAHGGCTILEECIKVVDSIATALNE